MVAEEVMQLAVKAHH